MSFIEAYEVALRRSYEAFNDDDFESAFARVAPDVEWHFGDWMFDLEVLRGRDQVIAFYRRAVREYGGWQIELQGIEEVGPGIVLVHQRGLATGRTTGIATRRDSFQLHEVGPAGLTRLREYATREDALAAVG